MFLFEWRSALGMRRVALASAESNEAPKQSEARSSPTRRETPKKINVLLSDYLAKMEHYIMKNTDNIAPKAISSVFEL